MIPVFLNFLVLSYMAVPNRDRRRASFSRSRGSGTAGPPVPRLLFFFLNRRSRGWDRLVG
jgi:hypothetical protein